ncbi:hypothetical protein [Agarilytica rhodophyticola]|uniref:hypothetical protein n=1 Tax=Agarilytica rhodophyticola TaxID=1737490 RepID=UPI000B3434AA|nr:hypothetical protein [Agarilytica rhodophyticola]
MGNQTNSSSQFDRVHQGNEKLLRALLDAQQEHAKLTIYLNNSPQIHHSVLLGFNYYENSILIDGLHPPVCHKVLKSLESSPFWLQLKTGEEFLNLQCEIADNLYDLYTLRLLDHRFSNNQRWFSRIYFENRRGPKISVTVPHQIPIVGYIKNLSAHGALAEFYGPDIRPMLANIERCQCYLEFNKAFRMQLKCEIRRVSFERSPSCHSLIRFTIASHDNKYFVQLDSFINALKEDSSCYSLCTQSPKTYNNYINSKETRTYKARNHVF